MTETLEALIQRLRVSVCDSDLKSCRENWPDAPDSWCSGCLQLAAADALAAVVGASPSPQPERFERWLSGEKFGASSGIAADEPAYGYGRLGANGYFEVEVPAIFIERLNEAYKARKLQEAGASPPRKPMQPRKP